MFPCSIIASQNKTERCNNKINALTYVRKKGICKNCGDPLDNDNDSEFCSSQCGIEYQLEHNRK